MKTFLGLLSFVFILNSCGNKNDFQKAENAFDAGRSFIEGCLQGDFKKAEFYMLKDENNISRLKKLETDYDHKSEKEKVQYHDASIVILDDTETDENTHIINYKNSYDNIARKVKVVKQQNDWLVDFKYTFDGNL